MDLKQYAAKVREMRQAQKSHTRILQDVRSKPSDRNATLELARALQSEVDALTSEVLDPKPEPTPELFTENGKV